MNHPTFLLLASVLALGALPTWAAEHNDIAKRLQSTPINVPCDELGQCRKPLKPRKWPPSPGDPICLVDGCRRMDVLDVQEIFKDSNELNVRIYPKGQTRTYVGNTLVGVGQYRPPAFEADAAELKGKAAITLKQNNRVLMHMILVKGKETP